MQYPEPIILAWVSMFFSSNQCVTRYCSNRSTLLRCYCLHWSEIRNPPTFQWSPLLPLVFWCLCQVWFCFVFFEFLLQNYVLFSGTCTFVEADSHDLCTYATPADEKSGVQNETSDEIQTAESREDGNGWLRTAQKA